MSPQRQIPTETRVELARRRMREAAGHLEPGYILCRHVQGMVGVAFAMGVLAGASPATAGKLFHGFTAFIQMFEGRE